MKAGFRAQRQGCHVQVEGLMGWLDKRYSYFSVVQFAGLIRVERIHVPCDLKLTLFIGGGIEDNAQAPHLRLLPMPLLSKASALYSKEPPGPSEPIILLECHR